MSDDIGGALNAADDGRGSKDALSAVADAGARKPERTGNVSGGTQAHARWARAGKVRLHPIPEGCPQELADYLAMCIRGAVRDALNKHGQNLTRTQHGTLVGSIGKRAVNALACAEGLKRLKEILR